MALAFQMNRPPQHEHLVRTSVNEPIPGRDMLRWEYQIPNLYTYDFSDQPIVTLCPDEHQSFAWETFENSIKMPLIWGEVRHLYNGHVCHVLKAVLVLYVPGGCRLKGCLEKDLDLVL
jgi:hypothetical protein